MKKFREPADRKQLSLLPPSIDDYVGEQDLVRYVDLLVDELDISSIERKYSDLGRRAFSPRMLIKVLFYGKMRGVRTSRELASACRENLKFLYLAGHEKPDFRTISLFRKTHHEELSKLLTQTIKIGVEHSVIKLEHVAIDGTRIGASAGRNSFKKPEYLREKLKEVERKLSESFANDIEQDAAEDKLWGDEDGMERLPEELRDLEALRKKLRSAVEEYDRTASALKRPKKISITDPESRYMKSKGINPSYSGLAAIDKDSGMVVAGYANNAVSDNAELKPCLEEIEENTGKNPEVITADKGFCAHDGIVELKKREIDGYVPPPAAGTKKFSVKDFEYNLETDTYICPNKKILKFTSEIKKKHSTLRKYVCHDCAGCPYRSACLQNPTTKKRTLYVSTEQSLVEEMNRKTSSEIGNQMAKVRGAVVESFFGAIKAAKKLRQFIFRGMNMINSMWKLELAAYNIEKLAKLLQRGKLKFKTI